MLTKNKAIWQDTFLLAIFWLIALYFTAPNGDFPLNDDFSYGLTTKRFVETGQFIPEKWSAVTQIAQTYLAGSICKVIGFSFTKLRWISICIAFVGVLYSYHLAIRIKFNRCLAMVLCVTLSFNPMYYQSALCYMTDIYAFTFSIISIYYFLRFYQNSRTTHYLLAIILAIASIFVRQTGFFVLLAFGFGYLCYSKFSLKNCALATLPLLLGAALYLYYNHWLDVNHITPTYYNHQGGGKEEGSKIVILIKQLSSNITFFLSYLFAFFAPILLLKAKRENLNINIKSTMICLGIALFFTAVLFGRKMGLPLNKYCVNSNANFGPFSIKGHELLPQSRCFQLLFSLATLLGLCLSVFMLYGRISLLKFKQKINQERMMLLLAGTLSVGPLLFVSMGDRYFLVAIALLSLFVAYPFKDQIITSKQKTLVYLFCLLGAGFTISKQHDYLAWNRAKWQALNYAMQVKKIPGNQIRASFEFYGIYNHPMLFGIVDHPEMEDEANFSHGIGLEKKKYPLLKSFEIDTYFPFVDNKIYLHQHPNKAKKP